MISMSQRLQEFIENYLKEQNQKPIIFDNKKGLIREPSLPELAERYPSKPKDTSNDK